MPGALDDPRFTAPRNDDNFNVWDRPIQHAGNFSRYDGFIAAMPSVLQQFVIMTRVLQRFVIMMMFETVLFHSMLKMSAITIGLVQYYLACYINLNDNVRGRG